MTGKVYLSPLTGDPWQDVRPFIGTIIGLANYLNNLRPRIKPPVKHDELIALATNAVGACVGIPKLTPSNEFEGRAISDAYWLAKEAKAQLQRSLEANEFNRRGGFLPSHSWRGEEWVRRKNEGNLRSDRIHEYHDGYIINYEETPIYVRTERIAWYAASLVEKAASHSGDIEWNSSYLKLSYAHDALMGSLLEMDDAEVSIATCANVERVWRFVVAAGRMPKSPDDDDLLAAFEVALMAGAEEFASGIAKNGFGG